MKLFEMMINVFIVEFKIFVLLFFIVCFYIWLKFRDWWILILWLNKRMKERRNEGMNVRKYEGMKEWIRGGREEWMYEGMRV